MSAILSACRTYRYLLSRQLSANVRAVAFVMLNPSTADENRDDPTIRKCMKYARRWGFGELQVVNLFAFRSTYPVELQHAADPVGPENDRHILSAAQQAEIIVCAWGANGKFRGRGALVAQMLPPEKLRALRVTGQPWHPLYLPDALDPRPWGAP